MIEADSDLLPTRTAAEKTPLAGRFNLADHTQVAELGFRGDD
jgi:hypothetical protein